MCEVNYTKRNKLNNWKRQLWKKVIIDRKNMCTKFRFKLIREIRSTLITFYKNTHSYKNTINFVYSTQLGLESKNCSQICWVAFTCHGNVWKYLNTNLLWQHPEIIGFLRISTNSLPNGLRDEILNTYKHSNTIVSCHTKM